MKFTAILLSTLLSATLSHADVLKEHVISTEKIFNIGSDIIGTNNKKTLAEDFYYFKANENLNIHIDVHSDDLPLIGFGFKNNIEFTELRAESLKSFLLDNFKDNINSITISGKGEFNPICQDYTPECRSKNRRAVIQIYRKDRGDIKMPVKVAPVTIRKNQPRKLNVPHMIVRCGMYVNAMIFDESGPKLQDFLTSQLREMGVGRDHEVQIRKGMRKIIKQSGVTFIEQMNFLFNDCKALGLTK